MDSDGRVLGGFGLGVAAALYYVSSNQKGVAKSDHKGQESYRTDKSGVHNMFVKDLDSSIDPSESDLPNDAPNNLANLDKVRGAYFPFCLPLFFAVLINCIVSHQMEQKQSQKPASKRSDPMQ